MPKYDASIPAFNSGEWSGRMLGRADLEAYRRACSHLENWEPFVQGSMRLRPGTKYLRDLSGPSSGSTMRLGTLRTSRAGDFGFLLADQQIQVFESDGTQADSAAVETVLNGDFANAGANWSPSAAAMVVFASGRVEFISGTDVNTNWCRQSVGPFAGQDLVFRVTVGVEHVSGETVPYAAKVRIGTTLGGAELAEQTLVSWGWGDGGFTNVISLPGVTGTVYISLQAAPPRAVEDHATRYGKVWMDDVSLRAEVATPVQFVAPWASEDLAEVQWAEDTGSDRVIFVHPNYEPRILNRSAAGVWAFNTPTWTAKPASWTGSNWPSVVEVYQGRLWLAAPPDAATTFWGSKSGSGNFFDFTIGNNPGDAFSYIAATKNAIRWMRGHRVMMMGAENAELAVTAASVIVGPGDVDVKEESAFGAASAQAVKAGGEVLYISSDRQKIRSIRYDFQSAGWVSDDITELAEHLFLEGIDELHYGRDPNNALIAVLKSGELRVCTYSPAQKVLAWWRWTTQGLVYSATVVRREGQAKLWLIVDRDGTAGLEEQPLGEPPETQYVDCHSVQALTGTSSPGWTRFAGQTVKLLLDSAVEDDVVVAADGTITTAREGAVVVAGLGYTARGRTVPPEGGNPAGTSQGMVKRWVDMSVRINRSALPTINGVRPGNQRSLATPLDSPEPQFTGDVVLTNPRGSADGALDIEQDLPLRTEVCAIFGTVQQDKV